MLLRWTVVVVLSLSAAVSAQTQNLVGQWQGTLGGQLRLVFVLAASGQGDVLSATMYSIDQTPQGVVATPTVQGGTVRMEIGAIGGSFVGKVSADGNSIVGTWSQGPGTAPLTLERATKETAWALPTPARSMPADAPTVFEVATIKPSNPDQPGKLFTVKGQDVLTINTTLADLMTFAYGVHTRQIVGGPSWMENDKFDVTGRPQAAGQPNDRQLRALIQSLLVERFKLAVHTDTRELPAFAIIVGNRGHKLTPNNTNPNGLPSLLFRGLGVLPAINASMSDFARVMQTAVLDRPVVDRTGLTGRFDITLTWTPDESQFRNMGVRVPPPSQDPNAPPGLFTAIQEQLGLRLDRTNAPVEVVVIDRVERPSEN
jgi:uncharacterized protein (TIGR03435 family)